MRYDFYVTDPKEVDINRVLDENPDQDVFVISSKGSSKGSKSLLVIRNRLLQRFEFTGAPVVAGSSLSSVWKESKACFRRNGERIAATAYSGPYLKDCRATVVEDVNKALVELKGAMMLLEKRFKVSVTAVDLDRV